MSLGALTPPVGGVAALREHLPAPRTTSFFMSLTIDQLLGSVLIKHHEREGNSEFYGPFVRASNDTGITVPALIRISNPRDLSLH